MLRDFAYCAESDSYSPNKGAGSSCISMPDRRTNRKNLMRGFQFAGLLKPSTSGVLGASRKLAHLLWGAIAIGLSILAISPTYSADEQCRSIKSDKGRLACFDRGAPSAQSSDSSALRATDQKTGGAFIDPVEWLRTENDKVAARLKGICRGC